MARKQFAWLSLFAPSKGGFTETGGAASTAEGESTSERGVSSSCRTRVYRSWKNSFPGALS